MNDSSAFFYGHLLNNRCGLRAVSYTHLVLHCHGARANMMGVLVKRKRRIPTVTTIHSDYRLDYMGNLRKHLTLSLIHI